MGISTVIKGTLTGNHMKRLSNGIDTFDGRSAHAHRMAGARSSICIITRALHHTLGHHGSRWCTACRTKLTF